MEKKTKMVELTETELQMLCKAAWMQANLRASIDELQNTACQMLDTFARHILGK